MCHNASNSNAMTIVSASLRMPWKASRENTARNTAANQYRKLSVNESSNEISIINCQWRNGVIAEGGANIGKLSISAMAAAAIGEEIAIVASHPAFISRHRRQYRNGVAAIHQCQLMKMWRRTGGAGNVNANQAWRYFGISRKYGSVSPEGESWWNRNRWPQYQLR